MRIFKKILDLFRLFYRSMVDFVKDGGMIYSASTAFYFLLSFFPVIFLIVYISVQTLGLIYRGVHISDVATHLFIYIKQILPFLPDSMMSELTKIIKSSKSVGIAGLITLLFTSTAVAESLISASRAIFNVQKVPFVLAKIITISVFVGAGILLALFLAVTSFVSNLLMNHLAAVYKFVSIYKGNLLFTTIIPLILIFVSYIVITYLLLPVKRRMDCIWKSGLFFTSFFMLAKLFYGYYLKHLSRMTVFYGSISALVILIVWVFYITTLYLLSLEMIKNMSPKRGD